MLSVRVDSGKRCVRAYRRLRACSETELVGKGFERLRHSQRLDCVTKLASQMPPHRPAPPPRVPDVERPCGALRSYSAETSNRGARI